MSGPIAWCAVADPARTRDKVRFEALVESLKQAGLETSFQFLTTDLQNVKATIAEAQKNFAQIRLVGEVGSWLLPELERIPSTLKSLGTADALVSEAGVWWPRFYLVDGLSQMLAKDSTTLDLGGSVFVFGATSEARAVISALSKIGLSRVIVSDPKEDKCSAFVEDLRRSFFGIQFQSVSRQLITQIPGICSIAVNTLNLIDDKDVATELAYFNFLKTGGFWLDLSLFPVSVALQTEALSVGASIFSGASAFAITDGLWARAAFNVSIDVEAHSARLAF